MKFCIIFSNDTILKIRQKPKTVITYKLHVSTGRRCQTQDCCPPVRSLGKCPRCDRHVWFRLPWSWGWHKTLRCHRRNPPGWVSSGHHPEKQPNIRGSQCMAASVPGAGACPGPWLRNNCSPVSLYSCKHLCLTASQWHTLQTGFY